MQEFVLEQFSHSFIVPLSYFIGLVKKKFFFKKIEVKEKKTSTSVMISVKTRSLITLIDDKSITN